MSLCWRLEQLLRRDLAFVISITKRYKVQLCNNPEHCAIPFRGLVPLSPFKERGKERIRKASPFLPSCFFFGYGLFLLLLGFFHIPSAFSSHCLFSSLYFGIDHSCSPYSPILDRKPSCLKRWVLSLTYHSGKSL